MGIKNILRGLRENLRLSIERRNIDSLVKSNDDLAFLSRPLQYLVDNTFQYESNETEAINKVEALRADLKNKSAEKVEIYYSPLPKSSGTELVRELRPAHGEIKEFDLERIADHTSVSTYWGAFLYLLSTASKAQTILELGSCAGISGCYLASSPYCKKFMTIEASSGLAKIAQSNLNQINPNAKVYNQLFDDALDEILPRLSTSIDLVWIDGHHEKIATIHYFKRLIPYLSDRAIVLFDDITWSKDMYEGWQVLNKWEGFSHTLDLNMLKGMGIWNQKQSSKSPTLHHINKPWGRIKVSTPSGWGK